MPESARADFNVRELPCYLSSTYETLSRILKSIEEQDSRRIISSSMANNFFDTMFSQILTF